MNTAAFMTGERLSAFRDRIVLRDPRACSRNPGLVPMDGGLAIQGPFFIRRHLVVDRERCLPFVEATQDPNPIHREGEVVPGAFLAAQMVSAAEILLPRLHLDKLRVSFTGVCWYGRSIRFSLRAEPVRDEEGAITGLEFEAVAHQGRREVATAKLSGHLLAEIPQLELPLETIDTPWLMRVIAFYESLGIDPEAWFHKSGDADMSYPIAFLASLPSGSMVRRFQGNGGILNRLTLEFGMVKLPLAGPPEVDLKPPRRLRESFNKILTWVKEGVETAVKGTALVLPRPAEDVLLLAERDRAS